MLVGGPDALVRCAYVTPCGERRVVAMCVKPEPKARFERHGQHQWLEAWIPYRVGPDGAFVRVSSDDLLPAQAKYLAREGYVMTGNR